MDETLNVTLPEVAQEVEQTPSVDTETVEQTTETSEAPETEVTAEVTETEQVEEQTPVQPFLSIRYNKQDRGLTQEEAVTLAQKGCKWDGFMPHYNRIKMMADDCGKSVPEFIEMLESSRESVEVRRLTKELGEGKEELAKELVRNRRAERQKNFKDLETVEREEAEAERTKQQETIAAQLKELKAEVPSIKSVDDVPNAVLQLAETKNIGLLDAWLRYQHSENRRIERAAQKQQEAAKASTGSVASEPETKNKVNETFSNTFRNALGL